MLCVVQSNDVADVIRRKLERLDSKAANLAKGPIDAFTVICQSGLARRVSWQAQVEEAVKDESDEFWRKVYSYEQIVYIITYTLLYTLLDCKKNSATWFKSY